MSNITMDFRVLGMVGTNVYLIINHDTNESILFDPADQMNEIATMIEKSGSKLKAVLLTHGHFDHVTALEEVKQKYQVPVYANKLEKDTLSTPNINLSSGHGYQLSVTADEWLEDGTELELAGMKVKAISTPGHTAGGMCYYIEAADMLISGDTLFAASVGRTDFPGGSMATIVRSVKDKLLILPDDTKVFPGHGESTSIAYEKKYNPYCQ